MATIDDKPLVLDYEKLTQGPDGLSYKEYQALKELDKGDATGKGAGDGVLTLEEIDHNLKPDAFDPSKKGAERLKVTEIASTPQREALNKVLSPAGSEFNGVNFRTRPRTFTENLPIGKPVRKYEVKSTQPPENGGHIYRDDVRPELAHPDLGFGKDPNANINAAVENGWSEVTNLPDRVILSREIDGETHYLVVYRKDFKEGRVVVTETTHLPTARGFRPDVDTVQTNGADQRTIEHYWRDWGNEVRRKRGY